jgi:hypothetical protein
LRDGACALRPVRADVVEDGAAQSDRVDAWVTVVAVILDGDDRVFQVGRNLVEPHVAPLLVEPEPHLAAGIQEDGVTDTAVQPVNRPAVARRPDGRHDEQHNAHGAKEDLGPLRQGQHTKGRQPHNKVRLSD